MTARSQVIIQMKGKQRRGLVTLVRLRAHSPERCVMTPPGNIDVYTSCVLCASNSTSTGRLYTSPVLESKWSPFPQPTLRSAVYTSIFNHNSIRRFDRRTRERQTKTS
ncbi:hypothetical protein BDY19DRAFT_1046730 [Irpex rosettiformis]|uniref:Uncharacterized protein n=1 Tax=Irpex rosettiformis TaxID=378272 RepID=A0ACB8UA02_9APHY|nr:hypothetical protein BDY19DRAFT_1046730 [Irpex rosettiformis]